MVIKFNSFREICKNRNKLENYILNHNDYWAHIKENDRYEPLSHHISLVENYWLKIIDVFYLESIVDKAINDLIQCFKDIENNTDVGNYIKELFWATMFFHDFGKINDNFQATKMNNKAFQYNTAISFNTEHSKLSAFIFFNHYLDIIYFNDHKLLKEEKSVLIALCIVFANTISKHHSAFIDYDLLLDNSFIESAINFEKRLKFKLRKEYSQNFLSQTERVLNLINENSVYESSNYFSFFALLKLSYSLLTASDYFATSEYMNGINISEFGIIDNNLRDKIIQSFKDNPEKPYNREIFGSTYKTNDISFKTLKERNNTNLNSLRLKMASEAVSNLRKNIKDNLFYLEAPTGSGKTNTSIALATVLLNENKSLSKIFYVFPFTTLVTQTFKAIKETIKISDQDIIQLHSKAGLPSNKKGEANYGSAYKNYIDYLFVNFPITILTHIRFFDVLKSNKKEDNYLLHRLANSIVIVDELQSYTPEHWDKVIYFIEHYAALFNIKFILMSATLPKIDDLSQKSHHSFINLLNDKNDYFLNPNFKDRVAFETINWKQPKNEREKNIFLDKLAQLVHEESEKYASENNSKVRTVIEFTSKRSAAVLLNYHLDIPEFEEYKKYLISGEILDSRRKEILDEIKNETFPKVLIITTQVIEAGVDIDMDLGFKDKSLIDSEEQLAGRINREAKKEGCKLFLFNYDQSKNTYGQDYRYRIQTTDAWIEQNYLSILQNKDFDALYHKVNKRLLEESSDSFNTRSEYWSNFKKLKLSRIDKQFKLIDQNNVPVFIPLNVDIRFFNEADLKSFGLKAQSGNEVCGEDVFNLYIALIRNDEQGFMDKKINLKKLAAIMVQFTISLFTNQAEKLKEYIDFDKSQYGYHYLAHWRKVYSYEAGFNMENIKSDVFI